MPAETKRGACDCGAFTYEISGEPKTVVICHCRSCQRQSGAAFGMSMVLAPDQFRALSGELTSFERQAESGAIMRCFFCPACGTRIYNQKTGASGTLILKPGTLDDPSAVTPARQLWLESKQRWIDFPEIPGFPRQPG